MNYLKGCRQASLLMLRNIDYLPTGMRTLNTLKTAKIVPLHDNFKDAQIPNPFISDSEKSDLIERAEWLCSKIVVGNPDKIIKFMPSVIGRYYQGEWAIYACAMTSVALCNIIRLYPDMRDAFITRVPAIIDLVNTPTMRYYDTVSFKEDAIKSLAGNKSHMTYLSLLAWMMGNFKLAGGDDRYDRLYQKICTTLNRRMTKIPDCNLPSFQNGIVFFPDMMFALISLRDYARLYGDEYQSTIDRWLSFAKTKHINKYTRLLHSKMYRDKSYGKTSGAYSALNTSGLALIDEQFAMQQYKNLKQSLMVEFNGYVAVREYLKSMPKMRFDIDAGPIIYGLSPSGTAFAMGAATYFEDWTVRENLLKTAELAGGTIRRNGKRHYRLANIMLTGEAIALAMRTLINFNKCDCHF